MLAASVAQAMLEAQKDLQDGSVGMGKQLYVME